MRYSKPIKLFWWRLENSTHGNFGDEITQLIIKKIFKRDTVWASASECEMIGAGSILAEVYETKGDNKPYVWSAGLIESGTLTIPANSFKFCSVRGKMTHARIDGLKSPVGLGDAGLLASFLLPRYYRYLPSKRYKLGILPHYVDKDTEFVKEISKIPGVLVIDATQPCIDVVKKISRCEAILSSSLHGLIVADSVGTPNVHIKISNLIKGGEYKFKDYYSVFKASRYHDLRPADIESLSAEEIIAEIKKYYVKPFDIEHLKKNIIEAFPYR